MKPSKTASLIGRIRALTLVCCTVALIAPPSGALAACVALPDGLVSWWRAEGNANDSLGTNHGTPLNGLTFTNGEAGQAFNFDGVDDQILVANDPSLNFVPNQDFSIEAWIEPRVSSTTFDAMTIVDKRNAPDPSRGLGYEVGLVGGRLECRISDSIADGGTSFGAAGPDLRDGQFHHVAVTIARNSTNGGRYYVDGAAVLTFDPTVEAGDLSNDQPLRIGSHPTPGVFAQFKGRMDEVSIYQRALSAAEVQALYNAGSAGKCVGTSPPPCVAAPSGLVNWWAAEGNVADSIGNLNGYLYGGTTFAPGKVGQAFSFDGLNDSITNSMSGLTNILDSYTMELWAWPTAGRASTPENTSGTDGHGNQRYAVFPHVGPTGGTVGAGISVGTNGVSVFEAGDTYLPALLVFDAPVSGWTHIAVVYANRRPSLYLNGVLVRSGLTSVNHSCPSTWLGERGPASANQGYYAGLLDEYSIYNRSLSANEIQAIYNAGSAGKCGASIPPFIVSQPTNQTVIAGGSATFTVVAGGTPPLTYQWRHEGTNIGGAISPTLMLTNVQFNDAGSYAVSVSNSLDSATSSNAVLTVNAAPPCVPPPPGLVSWWRGAGNTFDEIGGNDGTLAGDATYGVGRVGQGFVFDGIGDVVQLGNPTNLQTQNFTIEAWIQRASTNRVSLNGNGNGTIFGHDVGGYGLYLDPPTGRPALTKVGVNNVTLSTRITDTNFHHLAVTKTNTTIRFYIDGVAYSVASYNPGFVFTKAASIGGIGTNFTFLGSIDDLAFYNRALTTNEVRAIYNAGSAGKCASLTPPVIVAQPANQNAILGDPVTFTVTATGTPPLSYQWRFNGTNLDGATLNTLLLTNVQLADRGAYSVVVSNAAGTTNSSSATLTVNPPPPCTPAPAGLISWWRAEGNGEDSIGNNAGTLIDGLTFTNGEVHQAFSFDGVDDYVLVSNSPSLNFGAGQDFSVEAWIQPQVSTTTFNVMTIVDKRNAPDTSSGIGYEVAVVGGRLECRISDSLPGGGTTFGSAGPDLRDGRFHHVAVTLVRNSATGGHYYVDGAEVLTFDPTVEPGDLTNDQPLRIGRHATPSVFAQFKGRMDELSIYERALSAAEVQAIYNAGSGGKCVVPPPPVIASQPVSQTTILGDPATFTVTATGTPPLSYQWQFNGTNVLDATNSAFTLSSVQFTDAGNYSVLVTNMAGAILSSNAVLTVNPPPPCAPVSAGLISWWRAESNAADAAGTNTGTLIGGLSFTNGEVGQAFSFDGVDDSILVADAPSLNFGANQDFSIEAWIQPQASSTTFDLLTIVDKRNAPDLSSGIGYEVALTGGRLECRISDSLADVGTSFGAAGPDLRDGRFHHVAVTFTRNSTNGGHYYVDGAVVLTFDPTVEPGDLSNDQPLRIGSHATPSVFAQFKGRIDELSIYNQSLSANEIQAIYNAGKAGKCARSPLPDLALTLSGAPNPLSLGQRLTYTLHLTNSGLATATNVVVTDPLPDGVAFVSVGNGGSLSNGVVTFRLDSFASGASTDFTLLVLTTRSGDVTNTVTVGSDTSETSSANNTAAVTVSVLFQSSPDLLASVASPMTLNRQTGLMEQRLRLTNQGTNTLFAARVFLCGLPTNSVYNASGFANGCAFVEYNLPLAPGASVDFLMEYYLRRAVPDPTLVAVEVPLTQPPGPSGTPFNIDRSVMLTDGRFLIEFTTTPGRVYAIQYSDDANGPFKTAVPAITAPANRLQWLDDGPPKTESKPAGGSRFYRVFETTAP